MRLVMQGVGPRIQHYYDRAWRADETRARPLVVIGQQGSRSRAHRSGAGAGADDASARGQPGRDSRRQRGGRSRPDAGRDRRALRRRQRDSACLPQARARRRARGAGFHGCASPTCCSSRIPVGRSLRRKGDRQARLVVVRLLGGKQLLAATASIDRRDLPRERHQAGAAARRRPARSGALELSTMPAADVTGCWHYLRARRRRQRARAAALCGGSIGFRPSGRSRPRIAARRTLSAGPGAADDRRCPRGPGVRTRRSRRSIFYRALVQAADTGAVDALIAALNKAGLNALPIYVASLKESVAAATVQRCSPRRPPDIVLNATGFAVVAPESHGGSDPLAMAGCPVLQIVLRRRQRGAMARQHARPLGARHRDERGADRGRRPHLDPRHRVQGA